MLSVRNRMLHSFPLRLGQISKTPLQKIANISKAQLSSFRKVDAKLITSRSLAAVSNVKDSDNAIAGLKLIGNIVMAIPRFRKTEPYGAPFYWFLSSGDVRGNAKNGLQYQPVSGFAQRGGYKAVAAGYWCHLWSGDFSWDFEPKQYYLDSKATCVAFGENSFVVGTEGSVCQVFDPTSIYARNILCGHSGAVTSLALSEGTLVSGSKDTTCRVWDLNKDRPNLVFKEHSNEITCLAIKNGIVVSGSKDSTGKIWDLKNGKKIFDLLGHKAPITALQIENDIVVTVSDDNSCKVWSLATGECLKTYKGHTGKITSMQVYENLIATGSEDKTWKIWDMSLPQNDPVLSQTNSEVITCLQLRGKTVVIGDNNGQWQHWELGAPK